MERQSSVLDEVPSQGRYGGLSRAYVMSQPVAPLKDELKHMFMVHWIKDPLIYLTALGILAIVAGTCLWIKHEHISTEVISILAMVLGILQVLLSMFLYQKIYSAYKKSLTCVPRSSLGRPFPTKEYPVLKTIHLRSMIVDFLFVSGGAMIPLGLFIMIGDLIEDFDNGCIVTAVGIPLYCVYPVMLLWEYYYFYLPNMKKEETSPTKANIIPCIC